MAFQGPTAADALLNDRLTTRLNEHGRDRPCRPGGTAKSTLLVLRERNRLIPLGAVVIGLDVADRLVLGVAQGLRFNTRRYTENMVIRAVPPPGSRMMR